MYDNTLTRQENKTPALSHSCIVFKNSKIIKAAFLTKADFVLYVSFHLKIY